MRCSVCICIFRGYEEEIQVFGLGWPGLVSCRIGWRLTTHQPVRLSTLGFEELDSTGAHQLQSLTTKRQPKHDERLDSPGRLGISTSHCTWHPSYSSVTFRVFFFFRRHLVSGTVTYLPSYLWSMYWLKTYKILALGAER